MKRTKGRAGEEGEDQRQAAGQEKDMQRNTDKRTSKDQQPVRPQSTKKVTVAQGWTQGWSPGL